MNTQRPAARDITRITLGVVFIGLMLTASLWVLLPFVGATVWATMIVVATWPIMIGLQARLGGRRWLAVTIMTIVSSVRCVCNRHHDTLMRLALAIW